jgi:hypothetical protein
MKRNLHQQPVADGRSGQRSGWMDVLRRQRGTLRSCVGLLVLALSLLATAPTAFAEDKAPLDYQVKAAFLVNFPKYVEWPAATLAETNSPITVAILGDDNVANEFANMISGRTAESRPIVLKQIPSDGLIQTNCQILFIARSARQRAPEILEKLKGTGILTVGESDDFLDKGGVINMTQRDRKIRLQVNLSAARQAQLKISSRLLMVADVVKGKSE